MIIFIKDIGKKKRQFQPQQAIGKKKHYADFLLAKSKLKNNKTKRTITGKII